MKNTPFTIKYSSLKRNSSLGRSTKPMKKFTVVSGDVIQVDEADKLFSLEIRKRDGQCMNCGSIFRLGCSHYFGRGNYATRYNPLNCVALCQECHEKWEVQKDGEYKDFMIMWLGEEKFNLLVARSKEKVSKYEALKEFEDNIKIVSDIAY